MTQCSCLMLMTEYLVMCLIWWMNYCELHEVQSCLCLCDRWMRHRNLYHPVKLQNFLLRPLVSLISLSMQHSTSLIRSVVTQLAIFVVLTLSITGAWATYTSITTGSIATGQPVNAALMQQIKDNLDDLDARI
jgi:protein-S-isoprenylcysteine O-methyltransferase Ste14